MVAPHSPLAASKADARRAAQAILDACDPALGTLVGHRLMPLIPARATVAGFWPMRRELDMTPLLRHLREAGHIVALPRTPHRGRPLTFHRWGNGDALAAERFGTTTSNGPAVTPDILLVPLLAFDRRGHRLGYGGGYYDRTLALMPGVRTFGCAYAALELPHVPCGPHDQPLHAIATELELIIVKD